ncbi:MAG TPA: hypothetical protein VFA18_09335 [Gemmataceae bacterium]|nr:hypothetical protein [Gemmataceae bacterium]
MFRQRSVESQRHSWEYERRVWLDRFSSVAMSGLAILALVAGGALMYSKLNSSPPQQPDSGRVLGGPDSGPAVGQAAPNFSLLDAQTGQLVTLLNGEHEPVVLIFGSFS